MFAILLFLLTLRVDDANAVVSELLGRSSAACDRPLAWQPYDCPERMEMALDAVSDRELTREERSVSIWFGRHYGDSGHDQGLFSKGHRRGILSEWCPWHDRAAGMSTVGPHGLMYVLNIDRLGIPGNCVPWQALGTSFVSAVVAGLRYLRTCSSEPSGWSWCPRWNAVRRARDRRSS